jgi:hypothetical protein
MAQWAFRWRQSHSSRLCKFEVVSEWPTNWKYTSRPAVMTGDGKLKVGVMLLESFGYNSLWFCHGRGRGFEPRSPAIKPEFDLWRI